MRSEYSVLLFISLLSPHEKPKTQGTEGTFSNQRSILLQIFSAAHIYAAGTYETTIVPFIIIKHSEA